MEKVGRNDPCPCGSGKKHKHCCLAKKNKPLKERFKLVSGDQQKENKKIAATNLTKTVKKDDNPKPFQMTDQDFRVEK